MNLEISTDQYRKLAIQLHAVVRSCHAWVWESRTCVGMSDAQTQVRIGQACVVVDGIAEQLEQCIRNLTELAQLYDDHEATAQQVLAPIGFLSLVTPLGELFMGSVSGFLLAMQLQADAQSPVSTSRVRTEATTSPEGFADLIQRIPHGSEQIRIDRIGSDDAPTYFVYISGTRDFSLNAETEPWDMASNVAAFTGRQQAASERAVREAMRDAGITRHARVVLVGHSQGGLIAWRIAQSGDYRVSDVVLAGSPTRGFETPAGIRVTALEHKNDPVPFVSGIATSSSALTIRTLAPVGPASTPMSAHDSSAYLKTAKDLDQDARSAVMTRKASILGKMPQGTATAFWYRADRNLNGSVGAGLARESTKPGSTQSHPRTPPKNP